MEYTAKSDTHERTEINQLLELVQRIKDGKTIGLTIVETARDGVVRMNTMLMPGRYDLS